MEIANETNMTTTTNGAMTQLQSQLKFVCDKIEEALIQYRNAQRERETEKRFQSDISPIGTELAPKLSSYKAMSEDIKRKLETVYNIRKVEAVESEIKKKKETIKQMQKENVVLQRINIDQAKAITEYQNKYTNKKELNLYYERVKKMKDDIKERKEELKNVEANIKDQGGKINSLEERCKLIRDNIEYKKKLQMKEVKNCCEDISEEETDVDTLTQRKNDIEDQISAEEKEYKAELASQTDYIASLKKEMNIMSLKLKQIETSKRIQELKKREIKKIQEQKKRNLSKKKSTPKSNVIIRPKQKPGTGYGKIINEDIGMMSKTPNFKVKTKIQKPFEINKFNCDSNNNTGYSNKPPLSHHGRDTNDMLAQIENLKNEIQTALKSTNANMEIASSKQKIIEKINEQSAIVTNNDISDIKNDLEYLKELDGGIGGVNYKRKPFDKINFK